MKFDVQDGWSALGAMLILILVYLLLNNGWNFMQIIKQGGDTTNQLFKTLQGR
jgi:hypothetical protein